MPVNDRDAVWAQHDRERKLVADLFNGRETAKAHVRGMPGWDAPTLKGIQDGAYFLPMVARTVETYGGLVFMKAPMRTLPSGLEPFLDDVTQSGQEMDRFAEQALDGVMLTGSVMVLVDFPSSDERLTVAQAEARGLRPVLRLYDANAILSARPTLKGASRRVTHIRLIETVEVADSTDADGFRLKSVDQVRVLEIIDGAYQQRVWQAVGGKWTVVETVTPRMGNAPLTEIPAFFCNTRDGEAIPAKPPMTDLAEVSVAHLQNSAQYEWTMNWLGSPMLVITGHTPAEGEVVAVGSSQGLVLPDPAAKVAIVTAPADMAGALAKAMDDKRRDAAALGARMLMETPRAAIAAETARIERAGETSVVGAMANAVSQCLTNAMAFMAKWAGVGGEVQYWLSTDYMATGMDPQELDALMRAWMGGGISKRDLFAKLQAGEVVDPAKTFDDHEEDLAEEGTALGDVTEPEPEAEGRAV